MTFDELVEGVMAQGGFTNAAMAGGWVNEVHRKAVSESQWLMQELALGSTVVDQTDYDIPANAVDIVGLYLLDTQTGLPLDWQRISTTEMWDVKGKRQGIRGTGGVFSPKFGESGEKRIELYPAPLVADVAITALAAMSPATMSSGMSPVIPEDMHGDLMDGAIALGLLRIDERPDSAALFDAKFGRMVTLLSRRKNSRVGSRTTRIRVSGHDW